MEPRIDEIIERYSDMVYKIALTRVKKKEDAEDVLQDVFMKYMMNRKPFESREHEKAWLIRVTINCSNKLLTGSWAKKVTVMDDLSMLSGGCLGGTERKEESEFYLAVLNLPLKYRDAIHLFYYEELSVRQISQVLGVKESTVKSLLHRGRLRLKKTLGQE